MVSKDKWVEVIKDFQERAMPGMVERDIDIPLDVPLSRVVTITGPRRAGKTFEMFQLIKKLISSGIKKEQLLYVNCERADMPEIVLNDLVLMLEAFYELYPENKKKKIWLFIDEIQNVNGWESFVRSAVDESIKVYITGSSSKLLSKEIATSMRGRSLTYSVFPFSFREFLKAKNISFGNDISSSDKAFILNAFDVYLEYGGYPETIVYEVERERILSDIKSTAVFKDVIERAHLRNVKSVHFLIDALVNSKAFSINGFYNLTKSLGMKLGKNALYNYLNYLSDAFFVFVVRKFSYSYKKAEQSTPKIYFVDNGLLRISGINDKGRLFENLVFIELCRRNLDIAYYQTVSKEEVDFVVKEHRKVLQLIQACYNPSDVVTKEREIRALLKASVEFKCNELIVLTRDYSSEETIGSKKVKFIPVWKWLIKN